MSLKSSSPPPFNTVMDNIRFIKKLNEVPFPKHDVDYLFNIGYTLDAVQGTFTHLVVDNKFEAADWVSDHYDVVFQAECILNHLSDYNNDALIYLSRKFHQQVKSHDVIDSIDAQIYKLQTVKNLFQGSLIDFV